MSDPLATLRPDLRRFDASIYADDVRGWGGDAPIFTRLIQQVQPKLIIEVGSWKGQSAIHMARICAEEGLTTRIVCVDTWLGSYEFIGAEGERGLIPVSGYPQVYYQFLANVVRSGHAERIVPFPQTSLIAARWMWHHGIRADLIYLDGSHDYEDVACDIAAYRPLLTPGGVLFGDDYDTWVDVRQAVEGCGDAFRVEDGRYWVLR